MTTDVGVVRDDHGAANATGFRDLKDPGDGLAGRIVASGVRIPFQSSGVPSGGQQRLGGTLSIAVDPRASKSGTVYIAWSDQQPTTGLTLHVRRSTDRGLTWSPVDLLTAGMTINAALAINSDGTVGILYQQLMGTGASRQWVTHFRRSSDGVSWDDLVLARCPANTPAKDFDPYLGDYDHLVAVGKNFYGVFSANNTPKQANFPQGVQYQRNANFNSQTLLGVDNTTPVAVSIDPFFFKVEP